MREHLTKRADGAVDHDGSAENGRQGEPVRGHDARDAAPGVVRGSRTSGAVTAGEQEGGDREEHGDAAVASRQQAPSTVHVRRAGPEGDVGEQDEQRRDGPQWADGGNAAHVDLPRTYHRVTCGAHASVEWRLAADEGS